MTLAMKACSVHTCSLPFTATSEFASCLKRTADNLQLLNGSRCVHTYCSAAIVDNIDCSVKAIGVAARTHSVNDKKFNTGSISNSAGMMCKGVTLQQDRT